LHYVITDDSQVQILHDRSILFVWEQVEFSNGFMTARCGSQVKRFAFTPGKKRERYLP
jgi:hypothetical protein